MLPPELRFRPLGGGRRYPPWLRALRGRSGIYVLRERRTLAPLFVGYSRSGRLYQTLTRHLQSWAGDTAGPVYRRDVVDVAVAIVAPELAARAAVELALELRPRDSAAGDDAGDVADEGELVVVRFSGMAPPRHNGTPTV